MKWIHFSGLHIFQNWREEGVDSYNAKNNLINYLVEQGIKADYMFITGDFGNIEETTEIKELAKMVVSFIWEIADAVKIESAENILIVPGNGDLIIKEVNERQKVIDKIFNNYKAEVGTIEESDAKELLKAFEFFKEINKELYKGCPELWKKSLWPLVVYKSLPKVNINILCLNTAFMYNNDKNSKDKLPVNLLIDAKAFQTAIRKAEQDNPGGKNIVLAYDGRECLEENEKREIEGLFHRYGVGLYLCGGFDENWVRNEDGITEITIGCTALSFGCGYVYNNNFAIIVHSYRMGRWEKDTHFTNQIVDIGASKIVKPYDWLKSKEELYPKYKNQIEYWEGLFPKHKFLSEKEKYLSRIFKQVSNGCDVKEAELYHQICNGKNQIFYILGEGGMGKSAYVRKLALDLCNEEMIFPVYVDLGDNIKVNGTSVYCNKILDKFHYVMDTTEDESSKLIELLELNTLLYEEVKNNEKLAFFWRTINRIMPGKMVLLLDAKNEIKAESAKIAFFNELEIICRECPNCSIVITSRTRSDLQKMEKNVEEYEILPFKEKTVLDLLENNNKKFSNEILPLLKNPICLFMYLYTPKWSSQVKISVPYHVNIKSRTDIYWNYFHSELFTKLDSMDIYTKEVYQNYFLVDYLFPYLADKFHYISFSSSELKETLEEFYNIVKEIERKLVEDRIPAKIESDVNTFNIDGILYQNQDRFVDEWEGILENSTFILEKSNQSEYRFLHESFCEFMQALKIWKSVDVFQFYGIRKKMALKGENPTKEIWEYMEPELANYDNYSIEKFYRDIIFYEKIENKYLKEKNCVKKSLFLKDTFKMIYDKSCGILWKDRACNIIYDIYESYILSLERGTDFYDEIVRACEENLVEILSIAEEIGDFNLISSFARKFRDGFIIRSYPSKTQVDLDRCMELANRAIELYKEKETFEKEFRGYNQKAKCINAELENAINWYVEKRDDNEAIYIPQLSSRYLLEIGEDMLFFPEFRELKEKICGEKIEIKNSEVVLYCRFLHEVTMFWLEESIKSHSSESASLKALISEMIIEGRGETDKFNYKEVYKNYELASTGKVKAYAICKCTQLIGEEKIKEVDWDEEQFLCAYRTGLWLGKYVWGLYTERQGNFKDAYFAYCQAGNRFPPLIKRLQLMLERDWEIDKVKEVIEKIAATIAGMQYKEIERYQRDIWYANSKIIIEYYGRLLGLIELYKDKIPDYGFLKTRLEAEKNKPSKFNFGDYYFYLN